MKLTKTRLKQIIKEELQNVLKENVPNPEFRAAIRGGDERRAAKKAADEKAAAAAEKAAALSKLLALERNVRSFLDYRVWPDNFGGGRESWIQNRQHDSYMRAYRKALGAGGAEDIYSFFEWFKENAQALLYPDDYKGDEEIKWKIKDYKKALDDHAAEKQRLSADAATPTKTTESEPEISDWDWHYGGRG